jgi:proteasome lid subunit RPN8/RPN11
VNNQVKVPAPMQSEIAATAQRSYPHECCGVLIARAGNPWEILQAVALANINKERATDRFEIDPLAYQKVEHECKAAGSEIAGFFHSHPNGLPRPSPTDLEMARGLFEVTRKYYIYAIQVFNPSAPEQNSLTCWRLNDDASTFIPLQLLPA